MVLIGAIVLTLLVYGRFLFFDYISWDDPEMVFKNTNVKDFDLKAFFTNHYVGNYIPLTMFFHGLAWFLFDNEAWGHHALSILIHVVNGILVYFISQKILKNKFAANLTAIIFLLHPLQIESVGWISEFKNLLFALFTLLAIQYYLRFSETKKQKDYIYALLLFVLSCLSKPSAVVLPLTLIFVDLLVKRSFTMKSLINKIPFFVISLAFGLVNLKTQAADMFINYSHAFPYHERLANAGFALAKYLQLFILPYNLSVLYPFPEKSTGLMILGFVVIALFFAGIIFLLKKKRFSLAAIILLCVSNLVLVLQFIPFGEVLYADRYMYLTLIFFAWFFIQILIWLKLEYKGILFASLFVFGSVSFVRTNAWKSSIDLYSDIVKKFPDSFVALNSLGVEYMMQGQDQKSLEFLNKAVNVAPRNYKGYYNRGLLYLKTNRPDLAIQSFNKVLEMNFYHKAIVGIASAYYMLKDYPKAISSANLVLSKDPENANARFTLANCYNDVNNLNEALKEYNNCIRINGDEPDFYFKRAIVFGKMQDFEKCMSDLTLCIHLKPDYSEAYYWRGVAKVNLKLEACEDFKVAANAGFEPAINALNKYCP